MSLVKKYLQEVKNDEFKMRYWIECPEKVTKNMPLLVFLHGSGGHVPLNSSLPEDGYFELNTFIEDTFEYPFIVIEPILPINEDGTYSAKGWVQIADLVIAAIDNVIKEYEIDVDRIYISGFSMGGRGTWEVAGLYPDKFAALMPAGWYATVDVARKLTHIPVWAFNGEMDQVCNFYGAKDVIESFKEAGGNINYTIYSGGHVFEQDTLSEGNLRWLLKHNRKDNAVRFQKKSKDDELRKAKMAIAPKYFAEVGSPKLAGTIDAVWDSVEPVKISNGLQSGYFKILWDKDYLYVLVNVDDAQFKGNELDSIEIFTDFNNKKTPIFDNDCAQYIININNQHQKVHPVQPLKTCESRVLSLDRGHTFEVAIPIRNEFKSNSVIGFDICMNQYDEENKRSFICWSDDTNEAWFNPAVFGNVYLKS